MQDYLSGNQLKGWFLNNLPDVEFCSLRLMEDSDEIIIVRKNILEPVVSGEDRGVMITVAHRNGAGYGATCDLTEPGIKQAISDAVRYCNLNQQYPLVDYHKVTFPTSVGERNRHEKISWDSVPLKEKISFLKELNEKLKISENIVDWETSLWHRTMQSRYITSNGGDLIQEFSYVMPRIVVMANKGSETQRRSLGGLMDMSRQGGWEVVENLDLETTGPKVAEEALVLLDAPNCPTGEMDLLLDSGQMMLQVHESVGHPLEIDRILGDERNYAGTSFVTPDMFGSYQYGSKLMNITFDPTRPDQLASYDYDDEGAKAAREFIIKDGTLEKGLGSIISQSRSGLPGVANARATGWNRPPIDRMANLNLEPGDASFDEMVAQVENGVFMQTNLSWSIDDSRNKFQFGCEWGRLIQNGKLTAVVKNPNYRGISAIFWRNLKMVGNRETFKVRGTPSCGKGEPNQMIRVGHATPACLFSDVQVFGGEK